MAVIALTAAGEQVELADRFATPDDVRKHVQVQAGNALTGSALPEVWIDTKDGQKIRYAEVEELTEG